MNRISLIRKSRCFVIICKLLQELGRVDVVKLCFMASVLSLDDGGKINNISRFFELLSTCLSVRQEELGEIIRCVGFLEKNDVVILDDNRVSLSFFPEIESFEIPLNTRALLRQINKMKPGAIVRLMVQYV